MKILANFILFYLFAIFLIFGDLFANDVDYNIRFYGYSHHLEKDWFFHPGLQIDRDSYLADWFISRTSIAVYRDSGRLIAGFFHAGFRINARKFDRFYIRLGVGPTFIWRQNWWLHKHGYDGNTFYGESYHSNRFEYAFLWIGGDIELEWRLDSGKRFIIATVPGYPVIFANSIGIRF